MGRRAVPDCKPEAGERLAWSLSMRILSARTLTLVTISSFAVTAAMAQQPSSTTNAPAAQQTTPQTGTTPAAKTPAATTPASTGDSTKPDPTKPAAKPGDTTAKADSMPSPGDNLDPHIKKGSEEDVNAVGSRNIGGRGMGNWYSTNWEVGTGKQYSMEIEKSSHLVTDPVVVEYVNRVGQNLVRNSDSKVPFTIKVLDTDEINAMALPGGFFYVNSGLILNADEEAELAGVMAHEIAHVAAHHAARQMTRANYAQLGTIPLIFIGGWTGYGIYEAANIGIPLTFLQFSREFEAQADYLGVQYMYRAGYDPQAFISFFEKIQALEKRKPGMISKAFADHPQTPDRIEHSQDEIAHILPAKDEYTVTTSEFDDIKARLARIENKRRLTDSKDTKKPSLRKASNSKDDSSTTAQTNNPNSTSPDDQPTLHRRDDNNNNN